MRVGLWGEIAEEGEHLCGVAAGAECYEEVDGRATVTSDWGAGICGGEDVEDPDLGVERGVSWIYKQTRIFLGLVTGNGEGVERDESLRRQCYIESAGW